MKNFKSIAQRNAEFANMSAMEKRVALAKDVLSQLEMKRFIPTPGTYIDSSGGYERDEEGRIRIDKPIIKETCNVCALGALTVSLIDGGAFRKDGSGGVSCYSVLQEANIWSTNELADIEAAFEGGHYLNEFNWWNGQPDAETRMKEVMMNIVRNEGVFKPRELPFKV